MVPRYRGHQSTNFVAGWQLYLRSQNFVNLKNIYSKEQLFTASSTLSLLSSPVNPRREGVQVGEGGGILFGRKNTSISNLLNLVYFLFSSIYGGILTEFYDN